MAARAREALAQAIDHLADLDQQIAAAANATQAATDGRRQARQTLARVLSEPDPGPDVEGFTAAVAAGGAVSLTARPSKAQVEAPLKAEVDRWDQMVAATEAQVADLQRQRDMAVIRRDKARDAVVAGSGIAQALCDGLPALQAQVFARRLVLSRLIMDRMVDFDTVAEIRAALRGLADLPSPDLLLVEWKGHGPARRWRSFLDTLAADPDTPAPSVEALLGEGP